MANPEQNNEADVARSEQIVLNQSQDKDFNVLAVELTGVDDVTTPTALNRVKVDSDGAIATTGASASGGATEAKQDTMITRLETLETGKSLASKQLANDHDVTVSNPITGFSTSVKQDDIITELSALDTVKTTALTLTTLNTAYLLPASEQADRRSLIIYNVSDTDVYLGDSSVTTTNGILLVSGGEMSLDVASGLYAICGTSGKIVNVLELK